MPSRHRGRRCRQGFASFAVAGLKAMAHSLSSLPLGLARFLLTLWVGGLWAIGYLAAPVLFAGLPRLQAGQVAGQVFSLIGWIGVVAGAYLLAYVYRAWPSGRARQWRLALLGMLWGSALAQLFWLQPAIAAIKAQLPPMVAEGATLGTAFAFWHGLSSALYLLQSLVGLVVVGLGGSEGRQAE